MMNKELIYVIGQMATEKGIDKEVLFEALESALLSASKKTMGVADNARMELDRHTGALRVFARKKVVETLQSNRSDVVHLLDELARQLPEGIYLKTIKQAGNRVTINGYTQSQARVSTLMRNLEASPYLENANLIEIKSVQTPGSRVNEFTLTVSLERPKEEPEKGAKPAKTAAAQ